ncbi:MAG TPA: hypothetical protein DCE42_08570 [Myxococcales bacterium]|nr:hypothetical protein [Deltaproteobacteria bacterium]HAA54799.1 hypothetical protein [Myxococcales bacterium]
MHRSLKTWRWLPFLLCCLVAVSMSYSTGCGDGTGKNTEQGTNPDGGSECTVSGDCATGKLCASGKCVEPECGEGTGKTCAAGKTCKNNVCVESEGCKSDGDCPVGKTCNTEDGQCKDVVVDNNVDKVEIISTASVLTEGATAQLEAVAYNKSGARLSGDFKFKWASDTADAVSVDAATGLATGGSKDGEAKITAELEGKTSAPLTITNFAKVPSGKVRVIVRDSAGKPITGATVKVADKEGTTDANGAATVDGTAPFDVHVFHNDYSYFSAFQINKNDLFIQLPKNADDSKAGGVKGKFDYGRIKSLLGLTDEEWDESTVSIGFAGFAIPGNLLDIDLTSLLGENIKTKLLGNELKLPSGVSIDIAGAGKAEYQTLGQDGTNLIWALGSKFTLKELEPLIKAATSGEELNIGKLLADAKSLLDKFVFGFKSEITVSAVARVTDTNDINGDGKTDDLVPDFDKFPAQDIVLDRKLDQSITVNVSAAPTAKGSDGKDLQFYLISLAGVRIPGYGLVPLGLAVDEAKSGSNTLNVKYTKPEGVLASGKFLVLTIGLTIPAGENAPPTLIAANLQMSDAAPSDVTVSEFVGFGSAGKFDAAGGGKVTNGKVNGADFQILQVSTPGKGGWFVVFGGESITLPTAPDGRLTGESTANLFGVKLKSGQTIDSVLEFNALNMDRLVEVVEGFSSAETSK